MEQKNKELLEKQDYEIQVATLNERNRIAREIHDSVGHLLPAPFCSLERSRRSTVRSRS